MQGAEGTLPSKVYKFVACARVPHMLIAQRGRNSSCEYFYRSLGCPQLTLSSCDTGCVAQWSRINFHLEQIWRERGRIPAKPYLFNLCIFSPLVFDHFFPFCLFLFILTGNRLELLEDFVITYF